MLALAALGCWAPPAVAARVVAYDQSVVVWDAVAEPNDIQLSVAPDGRLRVTDVAPVSVASGCEAVDAHAALCPMPLYPVLVGLGRDQHDNLHPNRLVVGEAVAVRVQGSSGSDDVVGGPGSDSILGYGGRDRIDGGGGPDRIDGGNDADEVLGGEGDDHLAGGNEDDLLSGGAGADQLAGAPGNDDLDGGAGHDVLSGGPGADRALYADHREGIRLSLSPQAPGALRDLTDTTDTLETVVGSPHGDVIEGSDGTDTLDGGPGDDRISGLGGADRIEGGAGDDALLGDSPGVESPSEFPAPRGGDDTISGGDGADWLRGDAGGDSLRGEAGADRVDAREETSTMEPRDETVACGDGVDTALLDFNDEPAGCEDLQVRPRPEAARPPAPAAAPPLRGPGPQPILGAARLAAGGVAVPVHCASARACAVRVQLRDVRSVRRGGRRRSVTGKVLARTREIVGAGSTRPVTVALPSRVRARLRRGARVRLAVELRIGSRRWLRPLTLGS